MECFPEYFRHQYNVGLLWPQSYLRFKSSLLQQLAWNHPGFWFNGYLGNPITLIWYYLDQLLVSTNIHKFWIKRENDQENRENSPVTQTSPEPTLLSWGGGPREKFRRRRDLPMSGLCWRWWMRNGRCYRFIDFAKLINVAKFNVSHDMIDGHS